MQVDIKAHKLLLGTEGIPELSLLRAMFFSGIWLMGHGWGFWRGRAELKDQNPTYPIKPMIEGVERRATQVISLWWGLWGGFRKRWIFPATSGPPKASALKRLRSRAVLIFYAWLMLGSVFGRSSLAHLLVYWGGLCLVPLVKCSN